MNVHYKMRKKDEEIFLNNIKRAEEGATELLEHIPSISEEQLTSASFRENPEALLNLNAFRKFISNNYPSNSLILLRYLIDKGIDIKLLISNSLMCSSVLFSSLKLFVKVKEQIMLKNKKEEKAQLELVKTILELGIDISAYHTTMTFNALESRNLKIIKYFVSQNIDITSSIFGRNALHIALLPIEQNNQYIIDKDQQITLLKLIKYLVGQGVDIHQRYYQQETILHKAAKYHSLKIIKYLVSLGIDIHSLDHNMNNVLLSAFFERNSFSKDLDYYKKLEKLAKYFISLGVNIEHQNKDGMDVLLCSIKNDRIEFIKLIGSLMPSLKSLQYNFKLPFVKNAVCRSAKWFNIDTIKYLDEIPCFSNYFDGENKIKTKNSILFALLSSYSYNIEITNFTKFKEVFEFFLNKGNNINSIDEKDRIPIHHFYASKVTELSKSRKVLDYLIEKGSNLHHLSTDGSILYHILRDEHKPGDNRNINLGELDSNVKIYQENVKYIMIRSMEINSQIVDHPIFRDLNDEDAFKDFMRKDEEEENEEKVIKWKRGMAEILMKYPKILNLVSPSNPFCKFKFTLKEGIFLD